ncbi:MAG TPA: ATP-binding protein [Thermoanaerobaculia bacterium]|nr:ATP-binding protein [Thermoanaerobaculia bacterium]
MSRERIIGCWRISITAVMALLLTSGSEPGAIGAVMLHGAFALVTLAIPDWLWIARPVRLSLHTGDIIVVLAVLHLGAPLPMLLFVTQLVISGGLLLGSLGAAGTAGVVLLWQVFEGTPLPAYPSEAATLSVLLTGGILATAVAGVFRGEDSAEIVAEPDHEPGHWIPDLSMQRFVASSGASAVMIEWEDPDEPVVHQWRWPSSETKLMQGDSDGEQPLTEPAAIVRGVVAEERGLRRVTVPSRFDATHSALMVVPFETGTARGRLVVEGVRPSRQRLRRCSRMALELSRRLKADHEKTRRSMTDVARERERIARDLHDGPLQSVIGAKLQLHAGEGNGSSRGIVDSVESIGREISSLIRQLRPRTAAAADSRLTTRLNLLAAEVKRQWNVELEMGEIPVVRTLDAAAQRDLRRLIREAVVNAARHSGSQRVEVHGELAADRLSLVVRDHGHGFPFTGRLSLGELRSSGHGPRSLCERLELIGGDLTVDSTTSGSTVVMTIPISEVEA